MLIKKRSTVFCYDREWNVILDENEPVNTIEEAEEAALIMLKSLSED